MTKLRLSPPHFVPSLLPQDIYDIIINLKPDDLGLNYYKSLI